MTALFGLWLLTLMGVLLLTRKRAWKQDWPAGKSVRADTGIKRMLAVAGIGTLVVLLYSGASILWSIQPEFSLERFGKLSATAGFAVLGWFCVDRISARLDQREAKLLDGLLVFVGVALALGVLGMDVGLIPTDPFGASALTDMESENAIVRPSSIAALMIWPALSGLCRRKAWWAAGAMVLAVVVASLLGPSKVVALALILGSVAACAMAVRPRTTVIVGLTCLAVYLGAAPSVMRAPSVGSAFFEVTPSAAFSAKHRIVIWYFAASRIEQAPWLGHGLGSSRFVAGGAEKLDPGEPFFPGHWIHYFDHNRMRGAYALPLHPHNFALQVQLELGRVGAFLVIVILGALFIAIGRLRDRIARALSAGFMVSWLVIGAISYGAWQSWWISTLAIAGLFLYQTVIKGRDSSADSPTGRAR